MVSTSFFFPAAAHTEKDGSFTNTQRLLQWHHRAVDAPEDCRSDLHFAVHLGRRLKRGDRPAAVRRVPCRDPVGLGLQPARQALSLAALSSPTPGSTLPGATVTFTWNSAPGAAEYWLDIGRSDDFNRANSEYEDVFDV